MIYKIYQIITILKINNFPKPMELNSSDYNDYMKKKYK